MKNKRAQFMLVAVVLIAISIFMVFTYIRSADTSGIIFFEPDSRGEFTGLQNSIHTRNAWLSDYWFNLDWENRSTIEISGPIVNPVEVDPSIPPGSDCFDKVRVTDSSQTEISSDVTAPVAPCDVVFSASPGTYYVYWNNPAAIAPGYRGISAGNPVTYLLISQDTNPSQLFCPHISKVYQKAGIDLNCAIQNFFSSNQINYAIEFHSLDLNFEGFLS